MEYIAIKHTVFNAVYHVHSGMRKLIHVFYTSAVTRLREKDDIRDDIGMI